MFESSLLPKSISKRASPKSPYMSICDSISSSNNPTAFAIHLIALFSAMLFSGKSSIDNIATAAGTLSNTDNSLLKRFIFWVGERCSILSHNLENCARVIYFLSPLFQYQYMLN